MGGYGPDYRRRHIWFAEGCLPSVTLLEKMGEAEVASAESRLY